MWTPDSVSSTGQASREWIILVQTIIESVHRHRMTTEAVPYGEQAYIFLEKAKEELQAGDLRQASEKGWGAASQMIKAVADYRDWPHAVHGHLVATAESVADESQDGDVRICFDAAQALHRNFYEGGLSQTGVALRLAQVETLLPKLRSYLVWR